LDYFYNYITFNKMAFLFAAAAIGAALWWGNKSEET
jgi:hypothetical protein